MQNGLEFYDEMPCLICGHLGKVHNDDGECQICDCNVAVFVHGDEVGEENEPKISN